MHSLLLHTLYLSKIVSWTFTYIICFRSHALVTKRLYQIVSNNDKQYALCCEQCNHDSTESFGWTAYQFPCAHVFYRMSWMPSFFPSQYHMQTKFCNVWKKVDVFSEKEKEKDRFISLSLSLSHNSYDKQNSKCIST